MRHCHFTGGSTEGAASGRPYEGKTKYRTLVRPGGPEMTTTNTQDKRHEELRILVNSRHPIISVETSEETRLEQLLAEVANEMNIPLFEWACTTGLRRLYGAAMYNTENPESALSSISVIQGDAIFFLKDFAQYCHNDKVCRRLRDLAESFRTARRSIVISSAEMNLPPEIAAETLPFDFGLPTADDLAPKINATLAELAREQKTEVSLDATEIAQIVKNLAGLPQEEALRTLRRAVLERGRADAGVITAVLEARRAALRENSMLECVPRDASFNDVVGLDHLREWIAKRRSALTPEGTRFGLAAPKGVMIVGVQGCGKSLAARAIAGEWNFELARLDVSALYDKYVGETDKNLRKVLETAQKLAPLVLWIDEIEKALASSGANSESDAGLSQRMVGTLLTWMQDRQGGVFLAATSNNIESLPPEMLRKGRFDEIFFVDLPDAQARAALFALHLKKRNRDAASFNLAQLASASEGFSGAEIEQAIVSSLYTAFNAKQQLSTAILLAELKSTQPLSVTRGEDIAALRAWAKTRAVPAG